MGGSAGGGGGNQTQRVIHDLPEWSKPYWEGIARKGKRLSSKRYQPYSGGRVADFRDEERQAFGGVQSLYDQGPRRELDAATSFAGNAGLTGANVRNWGQSAYDQYRNPYDEEVTRQGEYRLRQQYDDAIGDSRKAASNASLGMVGGRGTLAGSREAQRISNEFARNLREFRSESDQAGYATAMDAFERDRQAGFTGADIQIAAGSQLESLAQTQQTQALQRITALQESGMAQRDMKQAVLDIAYQDFMDRRDWPRQQLNWYTGLLSGTPYNVSNQTTRSSGGGPSTGQTLAGLGIAGLGAAGQIYG